ncbi:MAG: ABC transporter substrate-binding protein, partial [Treponema sp.]|nr:ABC transporter substrate-binding protein [Treponema sp.]
MKVAKFFAAFAVCAMLFGCAKKDSSSKTVKIGIAKIVQHPALDAVERGVIDVVNENGFNADYDLQNANGDVNTAAQIALKYKDERV